MVSIAAACQPQVRVQVVGGGGAWGLEISTSTMGWEAAARLTMEVSGRRVRAFPIRAGNTSFFWEFCLQEQAVGSWEGPGPAS